MDEHKVTHKLNPFALGMSLGILWGICTFIMALVVMSFEYGAGFVQGVGNLYIGYEATFIGALIGLLWAFIDAFIAGYLVAWVYNCVSSCCCRKKCKKASNK
jgi:hypothetical protein